MVIFRASKTIINVFRFFGSLVFYQKGTMWHLVIMMLLLLFC